jgi:superfamily I DNA/RNA helicase
VGLLAAGEGQGQNARTGAEFAAVSTLDDMDGGREVLEGYRSMFHGETPVVQGYASKAGEIEGVVEAVVRWIEGGVEPEEIGIAVRFVQLGRDIVAALEGAGVDATVLGGAETQAGVNGVSVGTMHRMKGLEFRCVVVAGVSDGTVPMRNAVTPKEIDVRQHEEDLRTELSLLFVACTRAREALRVSWHGTPSPFLRLS